jgi:hypothetical protein
MLTLIGSGFDSLTVDDSGATQVKSGVLTANTISGLGMNSVSMPVYQVQSSQDLVHWKVQSTVSSSEPELAYDDFGEVKTMTFYRVVELLADGTSRIVSGLKITRMPNGAHLVWSNSLAEASPKASGEAFDSLVAEDDRAVAQPRAGTLASSGNSGLEMNPIPIPVYQVQSSQDLVHWTVRTTINSSEQQVSYEDISEIGTLAFYRVIELLPDGESRTIPGLKLTMTSSGPHLIWPSASSPPATKPPAEDIAYTGFDRVDVHLGNHGNAFTIASTHSGSITTVNGGLSSDSIHVLATAGKTFVNTGDSDDEVTVGNRAQLLDTILGLLSVNGQNQPSADTLTIIDSGSTKPREYTLTGTTFARKDLPTIDYASIESLNIVLGTGQNKLDTSNLSDQTVITIKGTLAGRLP